MRRLILIASVWAFALAKPEMYKESEDFQYSRSSSDDGTKSGFYGSQRGNMGGNYERAHNMDGLAQHQMSTAVRQVEGELGQGAKTRTGSVYTSAKSRGIFGSGNYDLSNLKGRNFEESGSIDDSLSHSSLTSQNAGYRGVAAQNAGYSSGYTKSSKHSSGYQSADYSGLHSTDYTHADNLHNINNQRSFGSQAAAGSDYKYYQGGSQDQSQYDANLHNVYDSNTYGRRVTDTPIRVVMRPGSIVTIPVAPVYDASKLRSTSYAQNSIHSEAEELSNSDSHVYTKPDTIYYNKPKHYESSYSYRKEWEKHNTQPVATIPTENPFPKNSELYDDSLLLQNAKNRYSALDSSIAHSSSANIANSNSASVAQSNSYTANTKSAVNKSKYRYESQTQNAAAAAHSNLYALGSQNSESVVDANDLVENINSKPKSYQSSYSYHKSWERRGDPYVIKPAGGVLSGQTSQKLVSASANQGAYSSRQYGSLYDQDHHSFSQNGVDCDCDENGQIRVARSADPGYRHTHNQEQYDNLEDLGQQTQNQWDRLEDLGQQTQNQWDRLEDLGQQTQSKWDNLQDLGQQTQNKWDNLHDLGQQTQNEWDNLELLGQQTQSDFQQEQLNVGQETQNNWDKLEKFNEQSPIRDTPQQTQYDLEPFHKQNMNEDSIALIPTFNHYEGTEEQKVNKDDSFWDQKQNFNYQEISQNNDQKETFANVDFQKESDQELQQQLQIQKQLMATMFDILNKNKSNNQSGSGGAEIYKTVSDSSNANTFYNHHNVNLDATENQNTGRSLWQSHYNDNGNTNHKSSPLESVWNKLDNLDSQGGFNLNKDNKARDEDAAYNSQASYLDWSQSKWENSHVSHDYNNFNLFSTQKVEESSTANSRDEPRVTPFNIYPKKPTQSIENIPITNKANNNSKSNSDLGRGDIGADETKEQNEDTENENLFYRPSLANKHYKTPEDIESLSLTKPKQNTDNAFSPINNKEQSTDETFNQFFENHENTLSNKQKINEHSSLSTQKSEHMTTTLKTKEYKETEYHNTYNFNKELSQTTEKANKQKGESSVSGDQQIIESNVEPSPFEIDQQITDQESQDFGQNLQNSFDLGQQIESFWEPSDTQKNTEQQLEDFGEHLDLGQQIQNSWQPSSNFEQSEVQQLENFANFKNNDNQQNQALEPQLENLGRSNDQWESQSMINLEQQNSWHPVDYNKDDQDLEQTAKFPNSMHTSYIDHTSVEHKNHTIKNQLLPKHKDEVPTPEEVATDKPGFWKSVGSKFSNAKDTVVSWFKKS